MAASVIELHVNTKRITQLQASDYLSRLLLIRNINYINYI